MALDKQVRVDKEDYLTSYEYDKSGNITDIRYADAREVRLSYNALRQLEEVRDWTGTTKIVNWHRMEFDKG